MKKRRINLFQNLIQGSQTGNSPRQPIKLGAHAIISIAGGILLIAFLGPLIWTYRRDSSDLQKRILSAQQDLTKLAEETTQLANQIAAERTLAAQNPNSSGQEIKESVPKPEQTLDAAKLVPIDQTWTSVLWKLSTFTNSAIVITKMDFQDGKSTGAASRKVVIDGQAGSQIALTEWMDQLANTMPSAELIMDRQVANTKETQFPIEFKVTATIL